MPSPIMSTSRMAQASPVPAQTVLGIGRGHGQRADGGHRLVVENRAPAAAAVGGLPDAARRRADVVGVRVAGNARGGRDAVADRRTHEAEPQALGRTDLRALPLGRPRPGHEGDPEACQENVATEMTAYFHGVSSCEDIMPARAGFSANHISSRAPESIPRVPGARASAEIAVVFQLSCLKTASRAPS